MKMCVHILVFTIFLTGTTLGSHWSYDDERTALGSHWSYDDEHHWSPLCKTGKSQSPIALSRSLATLRDFHPLSMHGYGQSTAALLKNNGHSAEVRLQNIEAPTVHGGGLPGTYQLDNIHFHWQSEHVISNYRFPLEVHLVHFEQKYRNFTEAIKHPYGVVVLGVLFDLSPDDDEDFQPLLEMVDNLKETVGESRRLLEFSAKSFIPRDKAGFYRYRGSLTTPECNEGVIWIVFTSTLPISKKQVKIFEAIQTEDKIPLTKNYRSLQPLNGRTLYLRVSPIRENGATLNQVPATLFIDDDSSSEPFSCDSENNPPYIPSSSSESLSDSDSESKSKNKIFTTLQNVYYDPGPSCSGVDKRRSPSCSSRAKRLKPNEMNDILMDPKQIEELASDEQPVQQEFSEKLESGNEESEGDYLEQEDASEQIHANQGKLELYDLSTSIWGPTQGKHLEFEENFSGGINPEWHCALKNEKPVRYFLTFLDFDIIDLIVEQTNHYATQFLTENENISNSARMQSWQPTDRSEIIRFIGLLGYMGIIRMNSIRDYWSTKWILKIDVPRSIMSRNRFELLLKMLHFSDNNLCPEGDRLYKVQPLLDKLTKNFQKIYTPGKSFCIDETMIPFQGRLSFRQYNPQKTHKYGIKMFKLCCENGYTWNLSIYAGKEKEQDTSIAVSTKIVLNLAKELLDSGRICITDNWYTSLQLAHLLLNRKTHCLGTLRGNRIGNPPDVIRKKLKKGEIMAQENERGICVIKWHDKRDVLVLTTCHTDETVRVQRHGKEIEKPKAIIEYNNGKSSIDISDQMSSYSTALRRTIRWYKKLAVEAILGTSMVNAHFIYKEVEQKEISITDFRLSVIEDMLKFESPIEEPKPMRSLRTHQFTKLDCKARENRKYCRGCYAQKQKGLLAKSKVKRVTTYCLNCEGNPRYCLSCFNAIHQK